MQVWHGMAFELMSIPMPFLNFATVLLGRVSIYTGICHYTDKITVSHLFQCALLLLIISSFSPSLFFVEFFGVFFFILSCAVENISFRYSVWYGRVDMVCVRLIVYTIHLSIIYIKYEETPLQLFSSVFGFSIFAVPFSSKTDGINVVGRHKRNRPNGVFVYIYASIALILNLSLSFLLAFFLSSLYGGVFVCVYISSSLNIFVFFFLLYSRLHSIFEDGAPQVHIISSRAQTSIAIPNSSCVLCHRAMLYLPRFSTIRHTTL